MSYAKTTWVEKVTKVGPTNLNHIEQGIYDAHYSPVIQPAASASIGLKLTGLAGQSANILRISTNGDTGHVAVLTDGTLMVTNATADLSLSAGTAPGSIVMSNNTALRAVLQDGSNTIRLVTSNSANETVIGGERGALITVLADNAIRIPATSALLHFQAAGAALTFDSTGTINFNGTTATIFSRSVTDPTQSFMALRASGDTVDRFTLQNGGRMEWGPGNAATDIVMLRQGAQLLRLTADMQFDRGITIGDGFNVVLGSTTGTKFGTGTTQKIGFFNKAPVIQPSSTGETVGFTAGGGTTATDASTFTGNVGSTAYRVSDIVKHLKNLGLIAT